MPALYAAMGGLGFVIAYVDRQEPRTLIAFGIGLAMEIAALTVLLRRQDYRARQREFGTPFDLDAITNGPFKAR